MNFLRSKALTFLWALLKSQHKVIVLLFIKINLLIKYFTDKYAMSQDKNIYFNIKSSILSTIVYFTQFQIILGKFCLLSLYNKTLLKNICVKLIPSFPKNPGRALLNTKVHDYTIWWISRGFFCLHTIHHFSLYRETLKMDLCRIVQDHLATRGRRENHWDFFKAVTSTHTPKGHEMINPSSEITYGKHWFWFQRKE